LVIFLRPKKAWAANNFLKLQERLLNDKEKFFV
jgi:hypothetical protein